MEFKKIQISNEIIWGSDHSLWWIDLEGNEFKYENGIIDFEGVHETRAQNYVAVGVDEYHALNGLSEAEMITTPLIDAYGNPVKGAGFAYTPLHSILAPMNYGEIWMQGLDLGITYLIPNQKITLESVPLVRDVETMVTLLKTLGSNITIKKKKNIE